MKTLYRATTLFLSLLLLMSCAAVQENTTLVTSDAEITNIELFIGRASVQTAEFEQLKLHQNTLFAECGKIRHGRFVPVSQGLDKVSSVQIEEPLRSAQRVVAALEQEAYDFDTPGKGVTFFDPGKFSLKIQSTNKTYEVLTSFDSVSDASSGGEKLLKQLALSLRSLAGDQLCSNTDFYGLKR